jgi:hypothetical protein
MDYTVFDQCWDALRGSFILLLFTGRVAALTTGC